MKQVIYITDITYKYNYTSALFDVNIKYSDYTNKNFKVKNILISSEKLDEVYYLNIILTHLNDTIEIIGPKIIYSPDWIKNVDLIFNSKVEAHITYDDNSTEIFSGKNIEISINIIDSIRKIKVIITHDDNSIEIIDKKSINPPQLPINNIYYASPIGGGNGSSSSPFYINDFWKICKPGDILYLKDGVYKGIKSMIVPPENISGNSDKPIIIKALNDGKVTLDGEKLNRPIILGPTNNFFILEGFDACNAGRENSINANVVTIESSNNILRRICAWEAADGNTNIFGIHKGENNLLEDCAGWGTARKTFSNSQGGNKTIFRRCFGRWEGSHAEGPKKTFGLSYNSYDALVENCIGTWDSLKMKLNYELHDYNNIGVGKYYSGFEVQQPDGIFSHDGFDILPDIANIKILGSIAYLDKNQLYHSSFKKWAAPFAFEIKGVYMKDNISFIEPGYHTDIWNVNLGSPGSLNTIENLISIGGEGGHISNEWKQLNNYYHSSNIPQNILPTKRYINGELTNENLWPWPMNQRIIDAMIKGGYEPLDITKTIFNLFKIQPISEEEIIFKAKQWLNSIESERIKIENELNNYQNNIDEIIKKVRPSNYKEIQKEEVFYNKFTLDKFKTKYLDHQFHMYVPKHYDPNISIGIILWLHGGGSWDPTEIDHLAIFDMDSETITSRSYPRTITDTSNFILVAPIAPFGSLLPHPEHASRWNVPGVDQYLMDIITEINQYYNIDYNKIVLAGFSMGGVGAYHQALRLSDRLSAVMASAGSWDIGSWKDLINIPMYIIHGTNDSYYISDNDCRPHRTDIKYAQIAYNELGNNNSILKEYPGGHSWDDKAEKDWEYFVQFFIKDKIRDPYCKSIIAINPWRSYEIGNNYNVTWTENKSPHTLWITIDEITPGTISYNWAKKEGTGFCSSYNDWNNWSLKLDVKNLEGSKIQADIINDIIVVNTINVKKFTIWLHPKMIDINNIIKVNINGTIKEFKCHSSLLNALQSYERRWDWEMIYHTKIEINL